MSVQQIAHFGFDIWSAIFFYCQTDCNACAQQQQQQKRKQSQSSTIMWVKIVTINELTGRMGVINHGLFTVIKCYAEIQPQT